MNPSLSVVSSTPAALRKLPGVTIFSAINAFTVPPIKIRISSTDDTISAPRRNTFANQAFSASSFWRACHDLYQPHSPLEVFITTGAAEDSGPRSPLMRRDVKDIGHTVEEKRDLEKQLESQMRRLLVYWFFVVRFICKRETSKRVNE